MRSALATVSASVMTEAEATNITVLIGLRLDAMADAYEGVMPLIREAVEHEAWRTLGYNGVSAWAEECFDGALTRLGIDTRREVVRELTAAGMSSRAIAPVVGISQSAVDRDRQVTHSGSPEHGATETPAREIVGRDGKAYAPAAKPAPGLTVEDVLAGDSELQRTRYLGRLLAATECRLRRFDIREAADLADEMLVDAIEREVDSAIAWRERFRAARPTHLRRVK